MGKKSMNSRYIQIRWIGFHPVVSNINMKSQICSSLQNLTEGDYFILFLLPYTLSTNFISTA